MNSGGFCAFGKVKENAVKLKLSGTFCETPQREEGKHGFLTPFCYSLKYWESVSLYLVLAKSLEFLAIDSSLHFSLFNLAISSKHRIVSRLLGKKKNASSTGRRY